jgi:hypothetical protein
MDRSLSFRRKASSTSKFNTCAARLLHRPCHSGSANGAIAIRINSSRRYTTSRPSRETCPPSPPCRADGTILTKLISDGTVQPGVFNPGDRHIRLKAQRGPHRLAAIPPFTRANACRLCGFCVESHGARAVRATSGTFYHFRPAPRSAMTLFIRSMLTVERGFGSMPLRG